MFCFLLQPQNPSSEKGMKDGSRPSFGRFLKGLLSSSSDMHSSSDCLWPSSSCSCLISFWRLTSSKYLKLELLTTSASLNGFSFLKTVSLLKDLPDLDLGWGYGQYLPRGHIPFSNEGQISWCLLVHWKTTNSLGNQLVNSLTYYKHLGLFPLQFRYLWSTRSQYYL